MGRPSKKAEQSIKETEAIVPEETVSESINEKQKAPEKEAKKEEIPADVENLMRLYPQYENIWITPKGFVHPEGVPEYLIKGAKLYKNKYYNK